MCRTLLDRASLSSAALRPLLLYLSFRTEQISVHRNEDSCLAVLPNSLRSQVMKPTLLSSWAVQRLRRLFLQGKKSLDRLATLKREVRTLSEFVTLKEKVLRHLHHVFAPARRNPSRCVQTTENQVETHMLCGSLQEKEKGFFLSIEVQCPWKSEAIKLLEEKKSCSIKTIWSKNTYCLNPDPSWISKNWWSKMQAEICMNPVYSFILQGWNFTRRFNYLINLREQSAGYAPNWTEMKDFFKKVVWRVLKK